MFTNAKQETAGKWIGIVDLSRIYKFDETRQFINYGVDGTVNGLVYAGWAKECKEMIRENRECVTICPFVSFSGEIEVSQVIFTGKRITSRMVTLKISNLCVSWTSRPTRAYPIVGQNQPKLSQSLSEDETRYFFK